MNVCNVFGSLIGLSGFDNTKTWAHMVPHIRLRIIILFTKRGQESIVFKFISRK